jgi:hypothetical protein
LPEHGASPEELSRVSYARTYGPCNGFEKVLERFHGGVIVEQYRTALLYLVPDMRSKEGFGYQSDDEIHVIHLGLDNQLLQIHAP